MHPPIEAILNLARWAPSGDNTQPWRFEVLGDEHVLVHGFDTREHCVYDLDGHGSQIAVGALIETLIVAATAHGRRVRISRRHDTPDTHLLFDVLFEPDHAVEADALAPWIEKRVVQRRAMSTRPLAASQKASMEAALPPGWRVIWFETLGERWRMATLCFDNARIRLTIPEAYQVHRAVIDWGARFSEDRIPGQAVGVDALTERVMRWIMTDWARVSFVNTWLLGHLMPRILLDLIPGLACAAHFALLADRPLVSVDDYLAAGRAMQRFWLSAAALGLYIQPEMTPVIFARYARRDLAFTLVPGARSRAMELNRRLEQTLAEQDVESLFFMGRIGAGPPPQARSTRKRLSELCIPS